MSDVFASFGIATGRSQTAGRKQRKDFPRAALPAALAVVASPAVAGSLPKQLCHPHSTSRSPGLTGTQCEKHPVWRSTVDAQCRQDSFKDFHFDSPVQLRIHPDGPVTIRPISSVLHNHFKDVNFFDADTDCTRSGPRKRPGTK